MTIFDPARGRVIDGGGGAGNLIRLVGLGIAAFILVILLLSAITRVGTGHVGVLTLFGRVTGETLGEGIHVINPLKTNNELSIQHADGQGVGQRAVERRTGDGARHFAAVPPQSGPAADLFQHIGPIMSRTWCRAQPARRHPRGYGLALR